MRCSYCGDDDHRKHCSDCGRAMTQAECAHCGPPTAMCTVASEPVGMVAMGTTPNSTMLEQFGKMTAAERMQLIINWRAAGFITPEQATVLLNLDDDLAVDVSQPSDPDLNYDYGVSNDIHADDIW